MSNTSHLKNKIKLQINIKNKIKLQIKLQGLLFLIV